MRHRIGCAAQTGLGNPSPVRLKNNWTEDTELNALVEEMLKEGIDLWFQKNDGCDFNIDIDESPKNAHIEVA